jgi:NAD(P)-dependent dehydrogenase (short-subunit alcohol dehydrogenase family)
MSGTARVLVTGGTGALGRALVELLLTRGRRVVVSWRRAEEWRALETDLAAGDALVGVEADLSHPAAAHAAVEEAARAGGLDGVALVAGGWAGGTRFEDAPEGQWERMLAINLGTAGNVCRAALPHLLKQGGSVVAVGARGAETDGSGMAAYAVAKSAVHALVRVLAMENRERGVRFNAVLPGVIDTPANRAAMPEADRTLWTPPLAIARVMAFCLSPESAPLTGALLPVDGSA